MADKGDEPGDSGAGASEPPYSPPVPYGAAGSPPRRARVWGTVITICVLLLTGARLAVIFWDDDPPSVDDILASPTGPPIVVDGPCGLTKPNHRDARDQLPDAYPWDVAPLVDGHVASVQHGSGSWLVSIEATGGADAVRAEAVDLLEHAGWRAGKHDRLTHAGWRVGLSVSPGYEGYCATYILSPA
jgi:hypothetical protein